MISVEKIAEVRRILQPVRSRGETIGLVPTMGALHEAHIELIRAARDECDFVVVSIFVNPIQFCPGEDYQRYPQPIEDDLGKCRKEGVDLVFNPSADEMYGGERFTTVHVAKLTETLCGAFRPGHFDGVTTVVAKLFNIIQPDVTYFGEKDAQQAIVVRKMIADLDFPITFRICRTVRDSGGLALSSRNDYLDNSQRRQARCLYKSLIQAQQMIRAGERKPKSIIDRMRDIIESAGPATIDYVSIVDPHTLRDVDRIDGPVLIAVAAKIGPARLIDNFLLDADGAEITLQDLIDR